ncbi:MAG: thiamine-phosphate kinase [Acidobacteria bacterium]|nr:thiamine-phosphate kinase [Acidobacteriota bacterium]
MTAPTLLPPRTVSELGERALVARVTGRLPMPPWVVVGPGDDAAVIAPERGALDVLTTDALVDGVHFDRRFVPPDAIGHRALAVNLSDLAAMGASPRAVLLSLVLPDALDVAVVDGLLDGLLALAATHGVAVVGGNISRTPGPMMIDITAIGSVKPRRVMTRSGARPGDAVYVTGSIGDGLVGLRSLDIPDGQAPTHCQERYLRPQPRVRAGMLLGRNRATSSCMDTSDGLADAVRQIADASGVGITLDAAAVPIGDEARRWYAAHAQRALDAALVGGDDYELLFTVRPAHRGRLRHVRRSLGDLPITQVGVVTKGRTLSVQTDDGPQPLPEGFDHFR